MNFLRKASWIIARAVHLLCVGVLTITLYLLIAPMDYIESKIYGDR